MSSVEVLTEVPTSLKLLVRIIMRCFYGDEHAVVMDKLIHHPCIKEDDLLDLLRFERKQLRAVITTLRNEKVSSSPPLVQFNSAQYLWLPGVQYLTGLSSFFGTRFG